MSLFRYILYLIGVGHNSNGFDRFGYDQYGFDIYGYDYRGYDRSGWNRNRINKNTGTDCNERGYNKDGFDKEGYDLVGWDKNGINRDTGTKYQPGGYDKNGYNKHDFHWNGIHKITGTKYDPEGYTKEGFALPQYVSGSDFKEYINDWNDAYDFGYNREGWNRDGWNKSEINKYTGTTFDKNGWPNGYDIDGWNKGGWDRSGKHKITKCEFNEHGFKKDGFCNPAVVTRQVNGQEQYELAIKCLHFHFMGSVGTLSGFVESAAQQGHAQAQYLLGLLFEGGKFVPVDQRIGRRTISGPIPQVPPIYYEPSPGSLFMMENGVPPDYQNAIKWYILAAKQGHVTANLRLKKLDDSIDIDEEPPSWLEEAPPWNEDEVPRYEPTWVEDCGEVKIIKGLNQLGIFTLWHMTHKDNIEEILNKGILSHTLAYKKTRPKDISDHDVQKWRESSDPIYDRKLHDYAPTYINIKNPMLYVKRNIQTELCLIEVSLSVLTNDNFIFSDGNAASRNTKFYNLVEDLEKLPWEVLGASYWNDYEDGKRKRCAEILIHPLIEPKHISKIHCFSHETLEFISRFNIQSEISGELFFK